MMGALLVGCGAASGQPSGSPSFQARIEEVARSLQNDPRLKNLAQQQRIDRVQFVVGNTLFVLLHELGHVIIDEMKLPVLGREEDAADTFAALINARFVLCRASENLHTGIISISLSPERSPSSATRSFRVIGTNFSQRVLMDASEGWFLNGRRDQQTGSTPLYYGEHNLSEQRAYQIVCLMVGSDPAKFMSLADETKMPQSRQQSCRKDYAKASWYWDTALKPHRRAPDQPETRIGVAYGNAQGDLEVFARSFREVRILETVGQAAAADFAWPAPFTMEMQSCGRSDAAWSDKTRTVRVCYELAFDFAQLYRAYVAAASTTASGNPKRKRKSK
jgi:hypothetical protein